MIGNRDLCIATMTLEIASDPKLRPQLEMRLTDDWIGFTVHVPCASVASGEPEAQLGPWIQKAAAIASAQGLGVSLEKVFFAFSGSGLSAAGDSLSEKLVQLWVEAFAAAGCWPELHEAAANRKNGGVCFAKGPRGETASRTQAEVRGGAPTNNGKFESGVSERLYGHSQNSGIWLRALGGSGNVSTPSTAPTPAPKQPVLASVLPTPMKNKKSAARSEIDTLTDLVRKYIRVHGAAPDFASDKATNVEKAYNYIRSTTARPNLTEDELEQVRLTLAKK